MSSYVFKNDDTLRYFICYIVKKNILTTIKLLDLRKLCKSWKLSIESESDDVNRILNYKKIITQKLKYDKNIYNADYYKRIIIKNTLNPLFPMYEQIKITTVNICYMDIDEDNDINYFVGEDDLPYEFKIFLQEYNINPTIYVRIYNPQIIIKTIADHKNIIRDKIINSDLSQPNLCRIIFLVPLCYSKHYRVHYKDNQFINVLCFVNIIDNELKNIFPDERYVVISIEVDNLEDNEVHCFTMQKYLLSIYKSIVSDDPQDKIAEYCYPQDLANCLQSFDKCFDNLIQNQR